MWDGSVWHCASSSECHGNTCSASDNSTCVCGFYYSGQQCDYTFIDAAGPAFEVYRACTAALHFSIFALSALSMAIRLRRKGIRKTNLRDGVMVLNGTASLLRVVWLIDPISAAGVYSDGVSGGLLLRLPQIIWIACMLVVINIWILLIKEQVPRWALILSIVSLVILCGVGVPITVIRSIAGRSFLISQIGNLLFLVFVVGLSVMGCIFARRLHVRLTTYKEDLERRVAGRDDTAGERLRRVTDLMANIRRTIIAASIIGWQLMVVNLIVALGGVNPMQHTAAYLLFLVDVHILSEGGWAVLLLMTSWQPLREVGPGTEQLRDGEPASAGASDKRSSGGRVELDMSPTRPTSGHSARPAVGSRDVENPLNALSASAGR